MTNFSSKASDGNPALTFIYPPARVALPVESPVQVWVFYSDSDGTGVGNQPIQFSPGTYTTIVSADTVTDADGFAHAVVKLAKDGTLGTKATFVGSLTAAITGDPYVTLPLHADTSAGGPTRTQMQTDFDASGFSALTQPPAVNNIQFTHILADGTPANCSLLSCMPIDPTEVTYYRHSLAIGDTLGIAYNIALTKPDYIYDVPPPYDNTPAPADLHVYTPNVITQQQDASAILEAIPYYFPSATKPYGTLHIGPADDMSQRRLPSGQQISFKAVYQDDTGNPLQGYQLVADWYGPLQITSSSVTNPTPASLDVAPSPRSPGVLAEKDNPPTGTFYLPLTNGDGETFFNASVSENGRAVSIIVRPYRVMPYYIQAGWAGLFYDFDNPPFVNESVRITPPGTRQTIGVGAVYQVTVLQGYDPATGRPYLPVANQTVYWEASPEDQIIFSPLTGPLGTVPGERFPTVTDSQGKSAIRISAIGSTAFFGTIRAKVANPETGTFFSNEVVVGFRPPA
ncbi:hypothetical protein [Brucella sp. IR073]|uniref:hypothetical protein n=1 Tax=unclassified Brucella TaxID=2632610 RepID=UPI003B98555E